MKLVRTWLRAYKVKLKKDRRGGEEGEDAEKVPPSCVFVEM